ncbi:MAG TPA: T9SS type A sorting domain-containing protein [Draconibacterium sp.]|nr:T9SS type A sorting domain-containing protein [Draconibacterium sp.]
MKRTFISILCIFAILSAFGQQESSADFTESQAPINIGLNEVNKVFTPPVDRNKNLKSAISEANINVTYNGFPENVKQAFEYAVSIWAKSVYSPVTINIHANWEVLDKSKLGYGKPSIFYRNFKGAPQANVFYPIALVEKLTGKEYNSKDDADILCSFNSSQAWYFGTDGKTPVNQYDFVTAVLHEIGHGLGISGFFTAEGGVARFSNSSNNPSIYDFYVFNKNQQRIADNQLFPCPSTELTKQLTSNSLVFNYLTEDNEIEDATIYAPSTWANGVSIYHLQKTNYTSGTPNELMNAHAFKGEAIHNPGINTLNVLSEIGWSTNDQAEDNEVSTGAKDEILAKADVNIYPNPFSGTLTFDCENIMDNSSVEIKIIDLTGSTVFSETMFDIQFNPKLKVDLSNIKPGIYLASLTDTNSKTITKRIIKN